MTPEDIARLMREFRGGDRAAAEQLIEYFYPELRRMAAGKRSHSPTLARPIQ